MEPAATARWISAYREKGLRLFTTSSFQSHSIVLLHILSGIDRSIPIYFINTGYLFPETVQYKDKISERLGMDVTSVHPQVPKSMQLDHEGRLLFASDPDHCCHLNKVSPMAPLLAAHDVWINGVRSDQSAVRRGFKIEEPAPNGTIRFHPMLDWTPRMIHSYLQEHDLPRHPLEAKGYFNVGCEPCTRKFDPDLDERSGRWYGLKKTECGLNTELVSKKENA